MALKIITPPAEEPVTLAEAKLHCKIDGSDDDALITGLIVAAREQAENRTGRALVTQTLELALDVFPGAEIELPRIPAQSIVSVKYLDSNAVLQTIDASHYALDNYGSQQNWAMPARDYSWPDTADSANAVKVQYVAGYGAAAAVPASIKAWMLIAIATLYKQRDGVITGTIVAELPHGFYEGLLDAYRVFRL